MRCGQRALKPPEAARAECAVWNNGTALSATIVGDVADRFVWPSHGSGGRLMEES